MGLSWPNNTGQAIVAQSAYKEIFMVKKINDVGSEKFEDYGITPCDIIFKKVDKPSDYVGCKSINVYDDRWRVNIYSKRMVDGIEGRYISKSYFTQFNKKSGTITVLS
jgi:hypothetical protein